MPKLKSHSGTKDRVRFTKNGKARIRRSGRNHFLQKKSAATKRKLAGLQTLGNTNAKTLKLRLGV